MFVAVLLAVAKRADAESPDRLIIVPQGGSQWQASRADVEKVLYSTASALWCYFPDRTLAPIHVEPKGGPIVLFERGPNNEYLVKLNTGETYWSQYGYQFAHEFCHILSQYDQDPHRHGWFEESLCELASIFALRRMSESWKTQPPYPNWRNYASSLSRYADNLVQQGRLPDDQTFAMWFRSNLPALEEMATDRPRNRIVAVQLLPLFEREPESWQAIESVNTEKLTRRYSFQMYLEAWHRNAPAGRRNFIATIAKQFEIAID